MVISSTYFKRLSRHINNTFSGLVKVIFHPLWSTIEDSSSTTAVNVCPVTFIALAIAVFFKFAKASEKDAFF